LYKIANEEVFLCCLATLQSDLNQALSEKDAAEQEVLTGKLAAERSDRQARQEQSRLQAEINSYKQRLERADADLVHCRRENLRLSEQIASLEKEVNLEYHFSEFPYSTDILKTFPGCPCAEVDITHIIK